MLTLIPLELVDVSETPIPLVVVLVPFESKLSSTSTKSEPLIFAPTVLEIKIAVNVRIVFFIGFYNLIYPIRTSFKKNT